MPRLTLLLVFVLLGFSQAQEWTLQEPSMPVIGKPGEEVLFRLQGPPKQDAELQVGEIAYPLNEHRDGHYFVEVEIDEVDSQIVRIVSGDEGADLGRIGPQLNPRSYLCTQETVTRQGPNPVYDRLTPLYAGQLIRVDGSRGGWHRARGSGTWLDGRNKGELSERPAPPNRLQRVRVEDAANGDALLHLDMTRKAEIQVLDSAASLRIRVHDTSQTCFDIRRPSGTAKFLGPILLRPSTLPQAVDIELSSRTGFHGYQVEPSTDKETVTIRVRRPHPRALSRLRITVDAGHGGPKDRGTVGHGGLEEQTLNLRVAKALAKKLEKLGAEVVMTRVADSDVANSPESAGQELQARIDHSIAAGSHLFLSVHHNARPSVEQGKVYHGTDIYWYQPHSQALAKALADPIADAIGEEKRSYRWRSFYVIRQTHAPAVLMEFQYLSNPELEREVLDRPDYPERAAEGVVQGLLRYLDSL